MPPGNISAVPCSAMVHSDVPGSDEDLEPMLIETGTRIEATIPYASTQSLIVLALGFCGLQLVFAAVFSHGSAFLNNLHFSKPAIALIWIAGPLCGAILQPYFGICSDQYRSRHGKRQHFIVSGAGFTILSLLGFAWSEDIGPAIAREFAFMSAEATRQAVTLTVVFCVFALNAAIQPLQCGLRALVADICPKGQQETVNAWVGRFVSIANILSYSAGYADLPQWVPCLGGSQFRILCVITSLTLATAILLMCFTIHEQRSDIHNTTTSTTQETFNQKLRYICTCYSILPKQVQRVCWVQFFAWMGWFPFLYYIGLYISIIYREQYPDDSIRANIPLTNLDEEAVRMGSLGLLLFAVVALLGGVGFPKLLSHLDRDTKCHGKEKQTHRLKSMRLLWMLSHIFFAFCMWLTFIMPSLWGTYVLVGLSGLSWAVTIWVPFAMIGMAIAEDGSEDIVQFRKEAETRAGVVLSLHNVAIAAPQVVAAVASSMILWALDGSEDEWSPSSIGWTLRIAVLSTLAAAFLTTGVITDR
ncbi:hypothetical protein HD806DRAFT_501643 [Xylariaceae sp. AK1471]|nr:hypothetical protein HD806DRAFT_501643 [Xylariaceae sp. AK1471]